MSNSTRRVISANIGTLLEWTEYSFYGYMAYHISTLFFPKEDPVVGLIAAYGIFAAGFLMRPLGSIFFGYLGDRLGRKYALVLSIYLMAVATGGIGLLPTYAQIGIWAPILLLTCRLIQGLAVSGEFNGSAIFLIEHAGNKNPYLSGCWTGTFVAAGMLLGSFVAALVTLPSMPNWSWRIPFFLGFVGCLVALYIRRNLTETPDFHQAKNNRALVKMPLVSAFQEHKLGMLKVGIFSAFICTWVYLCNLYYKSFLIGNGVSANNASTLVLIGQGLVVLIFPFIGSWADRIGGRPIMKMGLIGALLSAPFIFWAGTTQQFALILVGQILYALFNGFVGSPVFKVMFDLFPTSVRYTGTSFAWNLSAAVLGGTAPMLAQYWVGKLGWPFAPALYVMLWAVLALWVVSQRVESSGQMLSSKPIYPAA